MSRSIRLMPRAVTQLQESASWYEKERADIALQWLDTLEAVFLRIQENPFQFRVAREGEWLKVELRQVLFGAGRKPTHRILFTVTDTYIAVHQIRHVAMDDVSSIS